MIESVQWFI